MLNDAELILQTKQLNFKRRDSPLDDVKVSYKNLRKMLNKLD